MIEYNSDDDCVLVEQEEPYARNLPVQNKNTQNPFTTPVIVSVKSLSRTEYNQLSITQTHPNRSVDAWPPKPQYKPILPKPSDENSLKKRIKVKSIDEINGCRNKAVNKSVTLELTKPQNKALNIKSNTSTASLQVRSVTSLNINHITFQDKFINAVAEKQASPPANTPKQLQITPVTTNGANKQNNNIEALAIPISLVPVKKKKTHTATKLPSQTYIPLASSTPNIKGLPHTQQNKPAQNFIPIAPNTQNVKNSSQVQQTNKIVIYQQKKGAPAVVQNAKSPPICEIKNVMSMNSSQKSNEQGNLKSVVRTVPIKNPSVSPLESVTLIDSDDEYFMNNTKSDIVPSAPSKRKKEKDNDSDSEISIVYDSEKKTVQKPGVIRKTNAAKKRRTENQPNKDILKGLLVQGVNGSFDPVGKLNAIVQSAGAQINRIATPVQSVNVPFQQRRSVLPQTNVLKNNNNQKNFRMEKSANSISDECIIIDDDTEQGTTVIEIGDSVTDSLLKKENTLNKVELKDKDKIDIKRRVEIIRCDEESTNGPEFEPLISEIEEVDEPTEEENNRLDEDENESANENRPDENELNRNEVEIEMNAEHSNENNSNCSVESTLRNIEIEETELFSRFLETCTSDLIEDRRVSIIKESIPKIKSHYQKANPLYIKSKCFASLIESKIKAVTLKPKKVVVYFCDVLKELKARKLNEHCQTMDPDKAKYIKKLDITLKKLTKKIKKLEEHIVEWDDDDNSHYMQEARYKKRATQVYEKLCELTNEDKYVGRIIKKKLNYQRSEYPQINKAINKLYNCKRQFPNINDIDKCVKKCIEEHNINMSPQQFDKETKKIFKEVGHILQKRRKQELQDYFFNDPLIEDDDPAEKDPELKRVLEEHQQEHEKRIQDVFNKFAERQENGEDGINNSENSENSDENEDD